MSNLIVDCSLLACPDPDVAVDASYHEDVMEYLSRLADLSHLRSTCKSIRFWRDNQLAAVLHQQNCYPFRHVISGAFRRLHDPAQFQLEDVNRLAMALIERSISLEDHGQLKDIAVSNCVLTNDPSANRSDVFAEHLCRVLELSLPILGDGNQFSSSSFLATCAGPHSRECLSASYIVEMLEKQDGSYAADSYDRNVNAPIYRGTVSLLDEENLISWFMNADDLALIDVFSLRAAREANECWKIVGNMRTMLSLGREFRESARRLGFMHERQKIEKLLRVCADVLHGRNLENGHWLRVGKGANDQQKTRGQWRAWRHDVDREFHLHYWKFGSRIELANVVTHDDFDIS